MQKHLLNLAWETQILDVCGSFMVSLRKCMWILPSYVSRRDPLSSVPILLDADNQSRLREREREREREGGREGALLSQEASVDWVPS